MFDEMMDIGWDVLSDSLESTIAEVFYDDGDTVPVPPLLHAIISPEARESKKRQYGYVFEVTRYVSVIVDQNHSKFCGISEFEKDRQIIVKKGDDSNSYTLKGIATDGIQTELKLARISSDTEEG